MAYELYHEEGFTIERIAKLVKQDRETVEQWLQENTTAYVRQRNDETK